MKDYSFLLERPEHTFDEVAINDALLRKRVLITGAGGTIGSAIAHRVVRSPSTFCGLVGHSELPIFNLKNELAPCGKIDTAIVDVGHEHVMRALIERWKPDIIFHAAAHKHVGLMESQPEQAFANNTLATISLARVAIQSQSVRKFVFISTDKAVLPTSVMGASKRVAEVWLRKHATPFATICRFGNVLGSSGSLVEIIERKVAAGETITVSDVKMERFFITAKEAVGLVLTAALLEEGDCFSINMGKPIAIMDLIETLAPRARVEIVGKPGSGEKLTEEIVGLNECADFAINPALLKINMLPNSRIDAVVASIKAHPSTLVQEARAL